MIKKFEIHEKEGYDYYFDYQRVLDEDGKTVFSVCNLADCPEDAIIGRCLFDAGDWIDAVKYGMELAAQGYSDIETLTIEDDAEEVNDL